MTEKIETAGAQPVQQWVVCLCAAWCGVCRDYRAAFDATARALPGTTFVWVDIEDEAELLGDFEVESFPTTLIFDEHGIRFVGPMAPQQAALLRLVKASSVGDARASKKEHSDLQRLVNRLLAHQ